MLVQTGLIHSAYSFARCVIAISISQLRRRCRDLVSSFEFLHKAVSNPGLGRAPRGGFSACNVIGQQTVCG